MNICWELARRYFLGVDEIVERMLRKSILPLSWGQDGCLDCSLRYDVFPGVILYLPCAHSSVE